MGRNNYFLFLIIFISEIGFCQNKSIKKIELSDTVLVKTIKNYIVKTKQNYDKFNEFGYIELKTIYFNRDSKKSKVKIKYQIKDQYFRPNLKKQMIPSYYCYIEDKVVLVYDILSKYYLKINYSKKKQRQLNRLIKPFFKKPTQLKVKDRKGNIIINDKEFVEEEFNIHGGIILSIFNDMKFKIE